MSFLYYGLLSEYSNDNFISLEGEIGTIIVGVIIFFIFKQKKKEEDENKKEF